MAKPGPNGGASRKETLRRVATRNPPFTKTVDIFCLYSVVGYTVKLRRDSRMVVVELTRPYSKNPVFLPMSSKDAKRRGYQIVWPSNRRVK